MISSPLDTPFAEIAVDVLNVPADKTYHYAIPDHLRDLVAPGIMVLVGFGDRIIEGLVVSGSDTSPVDDVREVMDVVAESVLLTPAQIALARRISSYYLASPMKVIGPYAPAGPARAREALVETGPACRLAGGRGYYRERAPLSGNAAERR